MGNKVKTLTATIVFEDKRYPDVAITWALNASVLQLVSKGTDMPASVMRPVHLSEPTMDCAEIEAGKWFEALDIWEAPAELEADDDEHWEND